MLLGWLLESNQISNGTRLSLPRWIIQRSNFVKGYGELVGPKRQVLHKLMSLFVGFLVFLSYLKFSVSGSTSSPAMPIHNVRQHHTKTKKRKKERSLQGEFNCFSCKLLPSRHKPSIMIRPHELEHRTVVFGTIIRDAKVPCHCHEASLINPIYQSMTSPDTRLKLLILHGLKRYRWWGFIHMACCVEADNDPETLILEWGWK